MTHSRRGFTVPSAVAALAIGTSFALAIGTSFALAAAPALAAPSTEQLADAVTKANPFWRPLGAATLTGDEVGQSFGDPLPGVLEDAGVHRIQLLGFGGYCNGSPQGETLSAVVTRSGSTDDARGLAERLVSDGTSGGGALREAAASGTFADHSTPLKASGTRGVAVALTDNESEGIVRSGSVVVVQRGKSVVITTALCGEGRNKKERKKVAVETRGHARDLAASLLEGLGKPA